MLFSSVNIAKITLIITYDKSKVYTVWTPDLFTCCSQSIFIFILVTTVHLLRNIKHTRSHHLAIVFTGFYWYYYRAQFETSNTENKSLQIYPFMPGYGREQNTCKLETTILPDKV